MSQFEERMRFRFSFGGICHFCLSLFQVGGLFCCKDTKENMFDGKHFHCGKENKRIHLTHVNNVADVGALSIAHNSAVRMIQIYLSLYTACGCVTMSFACLSFFFPLSYANAELVQPAGLPYSPSSVLELNPGWNDWYDDGRDIGGLLSKAAPIWSFWISCKETFARSSWVVQLVDPGPFKGSWSLHPICQSSGCISFFSLFSFVKSKLSRREKFRPIYCWRMRKHTEHSQRCVECIEFAGCAAACQAFVLWITKKQKKPVAFAFTLLTCRSSMGWRKKVHLEGFLLNNDCFMTA